MQHFVKVMQEYIANQIIHVTWREFQDELQQVQTLDDLHKCHAEYLNKCILRSVQLHYSFGLSILTAFLNSVQRLHET